MDNYDPVSTLQIDDASSVRSAEMLVITHNRTSFIGALRLNDSEGERIYEFDPSMDYLEQNFVEYHLEEDQ